MPRQRRTANTMNNHSDEDKNENEKNPRKQARIHENV